MSRLIRRSATTLSEVKPRLTVMGLDLSLNSTGVAYLDAEGRLVTYRIVCKSFRGPCRLSYVKTKIGEALDAALPDIVAVEGYSMGRRASRGNTFSIAELGGVAQTLIWERGVAQMLVPPTTMKSLVALSGASKDKEAITQALKKYYGYSVTQNDEADATGLMIVGQLKLGAIKYPIQGKEAHRLASLDKLHVTAGRMNSISNRTK
jgi:Holliday junction resolvasome RuvABC endonuclease subunit